MGDRCDGTHWYQRFCGALLRWRIGVVTAAMIIGHVGNVDRFASAAQFASCNGTAPIEASSGERRRHRLNQRGNRQLNYAIHVAAVTQLRYHGNGQDYHQRKRAEGKTSKEAIRAPKRQISNSVRLCGQPSSASYSACNLRSSSTAESWSSTSIPATFEYQKRHAAKAPDPHPRCRSCSTSRDRSGPNP